nr:AlkA N-terminal domain-containing protein [Cellulomonas sp. C5510]
MRHRPPYDARAWFAHVERRAVPGLEVADGSGAAFTVRRLVPAAHGPAVATVRLARDGSRVDLELELASLGDLAPVVGRVRRWLDLDADPSLVAAVLAEDDALAPLVAARPGLRVPGTVDGYELAVRAVLGQQVSVEAARTLTARVVAAYGSPGPGGLLVFPAAERLAAVPVAELRAAGLTGSRAATVLALAGAVAGGLRLDPAADRVATRRALLALPGVGPWTAEYVALRSLADPDAFPEGDLVLRRAAGRHLGGGTAVPAPALRERASRWRPWRGYAAQHLWTAAAADGGP